MVLPGKLLARGSGAEELEGAILEGVGGEAFEGFRVAAVRGEFELG